MVKKRIFTALLLSVVLLLTACAGSAAEDVFQVAFAAPYVNPDLLPAYTETLPDAPPQGIQYPTFTADSETAMSDATEMKVFALVANHELDVMLCGLEQAAHWARGDFFYDLAELFTEEELAPYSDRLLSFDQLDLDGNPTGERTAVCGIDLSDNEALQNLLVGAEEIGVFIISSTDDLDTAKEFFWSIVTG